MFAQYLENSLQLFARQQAQVKDALVTDPISMMTKMTEQNMKMWSEFQNSFFGSNSSKKDPKNENKNKHKK
jgi:polyhydroxyalkanoate synthesis regulator protein